MIAVAFTASGVLAGLTQVGLLWRAVVLRDRSYGFAVRLVLVGSVLLGATLAGVLLPTAAGWGAGFAAGVSAVAWRSRP